jgi:ergothioneine biosynthesis protein EgtB
MDSLCLLTQPSNAVEDGGQAAIMNRYAATRGTSMALAAALSAEDCQAQSMPDASPVKWHLAHTTWFFETFILARYQADYGFFHPQYRMLFNSYYNAIGDRHPRPQRGLLTRPPLSDIYAYRQHVDAAMQLLAARLADDTEFAALVELGINHEQQHQELILTDLKHLLSCNSLLPEYTPFPPAFVTPHSSPMAWLQYEGGIVAIGHEGRAFSFDNEGPAHNVLLRPYQLAQRPVTQGEYLAFMEDGGYTRPELWLSLGWDAVRSQGWNAPLYWQAAEHGWNAFTLHGLQAVDMHAPVTHISYFEADAYARWAGARLPREAEWEHAAHGLAVDDEANMLETGTLHPRAAANVRPGELAQMFGDVWEWTASSYEAYPGFTAPAGAVGEYNGKFMCNQYVLRGGSCVTPSSHIRSTYRNFFPADTRWQFSGLRLAKDA